VFGLVDVKDIVERFEKGEIGPKEICEAVTRGDLTLKEAAELIGLTEAEAGKYCKELLREETRAAAYSYAELYQPATSGRGRSSQPLVPYVPDPVREVLSQYAAMVAQRATKQITEVQEFGSYVYDMGYYFCAADPRYRDSLMVNPVDTVKQFVTHAITFYVAYREILDMMEREIERANMVAERFARLAERYKRVVKSLLRRTLPTYIDEITARLLVALVDRYILARALGVPVDRRFTSFVYAWLRSKGVEYSLRYLAGALGLGPEELEEVVRG
jgi:hypothetical protein